MVSSRTSALLDTPSNKFAHQSASIEKVPVTKTSDAHSSRSPHSARSTPPGTAHSPRGIAPFLIVVGGACTLALGFLAASKTETTSSGSHVYAAETNLVALAANAKKDQPQRGLTEAQRAAALKRQSEKLVGGFQKDIQPFLKKYCNDCHQGATAMAGVELNKFTDENSLRKGRKTWERVQAMLRVDAMPPADHDPRPLKQERDKVLQWLDDSVFRVDCDAVRDPGRVTIRRLNRSEYNNTVRDLLGVQTQPAKDFPSDDVGYGFDNIGDVLSLPPLLMEKYLDSAEKIAEATIVDIRKASKSGQVQLAKQLRHDAPGSLQDNGVFMLVSQGNVSGNFQLPVDGEYTLKVEALADQAGPEPAKVELRIDGKKIEVFEIKGHQELKTYEKKVTLKRGNVRFAAAFINDFYDPKAPNPKDRDRNLGVRSLTVIAPPIAAEANLPQSHRDLLIARPDKGKTAGQAARECFEKFLPRAYRRPVTEDDLKIPVKLVEQVVAKGESYERGMQVALQAVLVSPHFLFRIEDSREPDNPARQHEIRDYELATRLSYFLWSSMPDAELFELAKKGTLGHDDVLESQVRRMLRDPKAQALVTNFGGQWLNLRILDEVSPDPKQFRLFTKRMKEDMRQETELFLWEIVREDRSLLDVLEGKYTYLNERLARHYGMEKITGDQFRRVALTDGRRMGVLTHGSVLTITSNPTRTSPVKRGKWILENILNAPPPPPPPNVPELENTRKIAAEMPLRKQMELHRKNAICASCHVQMDALGFGFENFDAVGRWRDKDGKNAIDSAGDLPSGEKFGGPADLVAILKKRDADFGRCVTEKLLTYALGRGLEYYDRCAVDKITGALARDNFRFSRLVVEITKSEPFRMRRGDGGQQ